MTVRLPDWPERLAAYIAQHRATPFAWGTHDCASFAAGAARVITGCNPWADAWADRSGAATQLRHSGGIVAAVDSVLPRLPCPALAQRGDVALMHHAQRRWLAVVDGAHAWAPTALGLIATPLSQASTAWSVGRG
jgi:hypothetical protein